MSSSENSFGWTESSNSIMSSTDDDAASIVSSVLDRKLHKKKLKQLVKSKNEIDSETEVLTVNTPAKKTKRKSKVANSSVKEEVLSQQEDEPIKCELDEDSFVKPKNKIKAEPLENGDQEKIKTKRKHTSLEINVERVKQEEENESEVTKSKKKRKRKAEDNEVDNKSEIVEDYEPPVKKKHKKNKVIARESNLAEQNEETSYNENLENGVSSDSNKPKKKKRKSSVSNNTVANGFSEEERIRDPKATTKSEPMKQEKEIIKSHRKEKQQSVSDENLISSPINIKDVEIITSKTAKERKESSSTTSSDDSPPAYKSRVDKNERMSYPLTKPSNKQRVSFSERINFEDDSNHSIDSENHIPQRQTQNSGSKKIDRFIECNTSLKQVSSVESSVTVSKNDDVWIIKCPIDLNHKSLKNMVISLENKIKIKVDGQTFDGVLNDDNYRAAILLPLSDGKFEVKDFCPKGTITYRKRIPKVDVDTLNVAVTPQSFIPLPETKKRHPLFGPDYRKRIKIPVEVAQRLADDSPKKKQKSKRKHTDDAKSETIGKAEVTDEVDSIKKKKKRKRKHSEGIEEVDVKKVKRDPEVWDSEKAIENSLFNF